MSPAGWVAVICLAVFAYQHTRKYTAMLRNTVYKRFISSSKKVPNLVHPMTTIKRSGASKTASTSTFDKTAYLNSLPTSLLLCYGAIGLCTLNKPILNLVIKLFPLIPTKLLDIFIGKIYCGGNTPAQVVKTGEELTKRNINNMMLSLTIEDSEGVKNIDIDSIISETVDSIDTILKPHMTRVLESGKYDDINEIPPGYIAIKPSAVIEDPSNVLLNYKNPEYAARWNKLNANCSQICAKIEALNEEFAQKYPNRQSPFFSTVIDAEKFELQQGVYELQRNLFKKFNKSSKPVNVVGTIQMYLKQSIDQIKLEEQLAQKENYRVGLKLVRGAYIHSEQNRSQVIFGTKQETDDAYNYGISYVLKDLMEKSKEAKLGHLVIATHNENSSRFAISKLNSESSNQYTKSNVVLGQLLGMCDDLTFELINKYKIKNIIKYVPWGPPVETKDYLLRRLQENGDAVRNDNGWPLVKNVLKVLYQRV